MPYCFDTSVFINAWNRDYPPDVFPTVWENIKKLVAIDRIVSPDEVLVELKQKDDIIHDWVLGHKSIFIPIDEHIQTAVTSILSVYPRLIDTRKNRGGADPFVIALAQIRKLPVVTYENATRNLSKPHIPDVCKALNIEVLNFVELARREFWQL